MKSNPKVSVVMPVYQAASTLTRSLDSILSQTFEDWELIVVDDGSEDETGEILENVSEKHSRIRWFRQAHQGIVRALNRGCLQAKGNYIARMDADDEMLPGRLGAQVDLLDSKPDLGLASSRVRYGGEPTTQAGYATYVDWINEQKSPEEIALRRFVESPIAHPSVMFRRELVRLLGGYREGPFPEDYELWLRWMDAGVRFGKVDHELLIWNDLPNRLSRNDPRYHLDAFYRLKLFYLSRYLVGKKEARPLWLWGAGRITRRRFRMLESLGCPLGGYVDIDPRKVGKLINGRPVVGPDELPSPQEAFILIGVGNRGARKLISQILSDAGFGEGEDFFQVA